MIERKTHTINVRYSIVSMYVATELIGNRIWEVAPRPIRKFGMLK